MFSGAKSLYHKLRNIMISFKVHEYIVESNYKKALIFVNKMNMDENPVSSYAKRASIELELGNYENSLNDYNKSLENLESKYNMKTDLKNYFRAFIYYHKAVVYYKLNQKNMHEKMLKEYYRYNVFDCKKIKRYIQKEFPLTNYQFHKRGF